MIKGVRAHFSSSSLSLSSGPFAGCQHSEPGEQAEERPAAPCGRWRVLGGRSVPRPLQLLRPARSHLPPLQLLPWPGPLQGPLSGTGTRRKSPVLHRLTIANQILSPSSLDLPRICNFTTRTPSYIRLFDFLRMEPFCRSGSVPTARLSMKPSPLRWLWWRPCRRNWWASRCRTWWVEDVLMHTR